MNMEDTQDSDDDFPEEEVGEMFSQNVTIYNWFEKMGKKVSR